MRRDQVVRILRLHAAEFHAMGVASLAIFGSVARDESTDRSDVDLLVDFAMPATFDAFMTLRARLEGLLGVTVDLVTRKAVRPRMRAAIEAEALRVA